MSVDTNTIGKNLDPYQLVERDGVEFLVPRNLVGWAATVTIDTRRSVFGRQFVVDAHHAHGPG